MFLVISCCSVLSHKIQLGLAEKLSGLDIVGSLFIPIAVWYVYWKIYTAEFTCKNNPVFTNPNVKEISWARKMEIFVCVICAPEMLIQLKEAVDETGHILAAQILFIVHRITWVFCLYFASCTPKPPAKSKIEKLKEKASTLLHPAPQLTATGN